MKSAVTDLAIFGGGPLFGAPRPIGQLDCPSVDDYLALVRKAYDARWLTNGGMLVESLEQRLAAYHDVPHCIALANAACGLIMLMRTVPRISGGEVIMPAFSYRGLPHFAQWAGHMPRFCDVDPRLHTLDPAAVRVAVTPRTALILAVANFNSAGNMEQLCDIAAEHDIPIILDSVYAMANTHRGRRLGGFGHAEVFSLHATKLVNGFEGGYVTTHDDALAEALRWQRNFSLPAFRPANIQYDALGLNAKLNELHAAMAHLSLDRLDGTIARNRARFEKYRVTCAQLPGLELVPYPDPAMDQSNYQMAVAEVGASWPLTRDQTVRLLRAEGAQISGYYSPALHRSPHCPSGMDVPALPVSERLAETYLQFPVGDLVSLEDIDQLGALLQFVVSQGARIRARLEGLPA